MPYQTPASWDEGQRLSAQNFMQAAVKLGYSSQRVINELKELGLSYRRIDMLHDIRYAGAVANAKYPDTAERAAGWFDNVFEPYRAEKGLTANQASDLWNKSRNQTWDTLEQMSEGLDMLERYEATFGQ